MNTRHKYLISALAAVVFLAFGTAAALAERNDRSKRSGQAPVRANPVRTGQVHANPVHASPSHVKPAHTPSHASQALATHSARSNLAPSSMHRTRPGYQGFRAEANYRHPYPIRPVHRHPSAVVVARPFVIYPPVVYDTTCIRIVNLVQLGITASYILDGQPVFLPPGGIQTLYRPCVITFDRGNGYGFTQLVLTEGTYAIGLAFDGGWSLFRD